MRYASLSGEEIRQRVEGKGAFFCAIKDGKLCGTAAIIEKKTKFWFNAEPVIYAYLCFVCVLPEYTGWGIYKQLYKFIERERKNRGLSQLMFDTHENNKRMIDINHINGFVPVDYRFYKDHFNVVMVNWPNGCPYSNGRLKFEFIKRIIATKLKYGLRRMFHIL